MPAGTCTYKYLPLSGCSARHREDDALHYVIPGTPDAKNDHRLSETGGTKPPSPLHAMPSPVKSQETVGTSKCQILSVRVCLYIIYNLHVGGLSAKFW